VAWSSTISTRLPTKRVPSSGTGSRRASGAAAAGTVNVTVVPAPSLLRAVTVPPISSHSRRQIARPSPVPP
jgi:hypothetical protein